MQESPESPRVTDMTAAGWAAWAGLPGPGCLGRWGPVSLVQGGPMPGDKSLRGFRDERRLRLPSDPVAPETRLIRSDSFAGPTCDPSRSALGKAAWRLLRGPPSQRVMGGPPEGS